ncbi:MAG TPA: CpsD/CapB family tyrosine-protein kinase [Nitrospiria bacterium]|nr:CpsD/CapB family tyrosine-protein kinase [Nitrospiria bacterium]
MLNRNWFKNAPQKAIQMIAYSQPGSLIAEQYRVLYTKIDKLNQQNSRKVLAITSAVKGEGKTTTAVNLGIVMARDFHQRVLLIEADLKLPTFHTFLEETVLFGFDDLLREDPHVEWRANPPALVSFAHDNLTLLPVSAKSNDARPLLRPGRLEGLLNRLKKDYDYVLLDAPPVLPMADANRIVHVVDGVLFVVAAGLTPASLVKRAILTLELDQSKLIGTVLTRSELVQSKYFHGYQI